MVTFVINDFAISPLICLLLILSIGISHGSLDNIKGKKLFQIFGINNLSVFYLLYILIIVLIAFTLTSIFYAFKTYIPRINQKLKKSVFFFHDINFHYKEADVYSKELIKVIQIDKSILSSNLQVNLIHSKEKYSKKPFVLIVGGGGFIGSNFIIHVLKNYNDFEIINLDPKRDPPELSIMICSMLSKFSLVISLLSINPF